MSDLVRNPEGLFSRILAHNSIIELLNYLLQDCQEVKCIAPGSTNAVKLSRFFDKVSITT